METAKKQPTTKKVERSTSAPYQPTKADTLSMLSRTIQVMQESGHEVHKQEIPKQGERPAGIIFFVPHAQIKDEKIIMWDSPEVARDGIIGD